MKTTHNYEGTELTWTVAAKLSNGRVVRQDRKEPDLEMALAGFFFELGKTIQFMGETGPWGRPVEIEKFTYAQRLAYIPDEVIEVALEIGIEGQE